MLIILVSGLEFHFDQNLTKLILFLFLLLFNLLKNPIIILQTTKIESQQSLPPILHQSTHRYINHIFLLITQVGDLQTVIFLQFYGKTNLR